MSYASCVGCKKKIPKSIHLLVFGTDTYKCWLCDFYEKTEQRKTITNQSEKYR